MEALDPGGSPRPAPGAHVDRRRPHRAPPPPPRKAHEGTRAQRSASVDFSLPGFAAIPLRTGHPAALLSRVHRALHGAARCPTAQPPPTHATPRALVLSKCQTIAWASKFFPKGEYQTRCARGAHAVHARCGYWGCSVDPFIQSQSGGMVTPQSPAGTIYNSSPRRPYPGEVVQIPDAVRARCMRGARAVRILPQRIRLDPPAGLVRYARTVRALR